MKTTALDSQDLGIPEVARDSMKEEFWNMLQLISRSSLPFDTLAFDLLLKRTCEELQSQNEVNSNIEVQLAIFKKKLYAFFFENEELKLAIRSKDDVSIDRVWRKVLLTQAEASM